MVADEAMISMEVRGETDEINQYMDRRAKEICQAAAAMEECSCEMKLMGRAPSQVSSPELIERISNLVRNHLPQYRISSNPNAKNWGSEDIGFMMNRVQEQGGQAGGMSICTDQYRADERLILGFHVVPDCWLLQGGTTGGGGVMRWLEREFGAYEREEGKRQGKSSLDLFNEEAAAVAPGSDGVVFLPYMSGERTPIWDPNAKGVYYGLDFSKTKGHFIRAAMEGTAYALKHNLDVAEEAGAKVEVLRAMGGSANSLLWTQIKSDITGKPIVVPSSDTATTLGAVILAGVGIGMYKDFDEAVKLTVEEKRSHEPNNENRKVYDRNYETYIELYKQLKDTMAKNHE